MIVKLLAFQWKEVMRSNASGQQVVKGVVLLVTSILSFFYGMGLGVVSAWLLRDSRPNVDVVVSFTSFLFFGLILFLLLRFLVAGDPKLAIQKYLMLNTPKSDLQNFLIFKYFFHPLNATLFGVILSFFLFNVIQRLPAYESGLWILNVLGAIGCANFMSLFLSKSLSTNRKVSYPVTGVLMIFMFFQYKGYIDILPFLIQFYDLGFTSIPFLLIVLLLMVISYYLVFMALGKMMYLDGTSDKIGSGFSFKTLQKYGALGYWMQMEMKLIVRNKLARRILIISVLFLIYSFILLSFESSMFQRVVYGMLISSCFLINYGSLLFSWDSSHFDFVIARSPTVETYLKAKYYICVLSCLISVLISMPICYFDASFIWVILGLCLYNIGITLPTLFWFCAYNNMKLKLNVMQVNANQSFTFNAFVYIFLIYFLPTIIYGVFYFCGISEFILNFLAIIGLIGLSCSFYIFRIIVSVIKNQKYSLRKRLVL